MKDDSGLIRVLCLLLLAMAFCAGLYFVPTHLFHLTLKRVDLLSDIRKPSQIIDSVAMQEDLLVVDSVALRDSLIRQHNMDSLTLIARDSLYDQMTAQFANDSNVIHIEDYSPAHVGLRHFFEMLGKSDTLSRPVYVAYLGDSFIEGDIIVADFRHALQSRFGGGGVGFVPISTVSQQFRPTVKQSATGWKNWSMMHDRSRPYTLSGMFFDATDSIATITTKAGSRYSELKNVQSMKLIYARNTATTMRMVANGRDTIVEKLPPTNDVTQFVKNGNITSAQFVFNQTAGFSALGIAMDSRKGVVVDNYSLRGNSGIILQRLNAKDCASLNHIRPYDLIILEYGLNVTSDSLVHYGWYTGKMTKAISHLRTCFPQADVLLLGVSDRSTHVDGALGTMPAVEALIRSQRNMAQSLGLPFWDVFRAMGGSNSMVRYVDLNWASKDYTHLGFRGGKEIAQRLFDALMEEKKFYDEVEKMVP